MTKEQYIKVIKSVIESPRNNLQKITMLQQSFELYVEEHQDLGFTSEEIVCMAKFYKEHTSAEAIAENMRIVAKLLEAERKEAHWIKHEYAEESEGLLIPNYECSKCHTWKRENSDYCPDCGCKMTEVI